STSRTSAERTAAGCKTAGCRFDPCPTCPESLNSCGSLPLYPQRNVRALTPSDPNCTAPRATPQISECDPLALDILLKQALGEVSDELRAEPFPDGGVRCRAAVVRHEIGVGGLDSVPIVRGYTLAVPDG